MFTAPTTVLKGHEGAVHVVRYNSNGQYCVSGGQDRKINLWNPNSGAKIKSYEAHGWEVLDIAVASDNAKLASVGGDKTVYFPCLTVFLT
jgi:mitogen-activated protein kinase organizer 1